MKKNKGWLMWGIVILVLAAGYLNFRHQNSQSAERKGAEGHMQFEATSASENMAHKTTPSLDGEGVTVIGDSVIVGVEPYLKDKLPKITIEGKVGRQMSEAQALIDELRAKGKLGDKIIIELGTNGPFSKKSLRNLLESLSDKQVLVVTTRVPKGWQDTVNSCIKDVASEYRNAKVVDWYAASEGKEELFYKDGVHLKPDGSKYYTSLLIEALQEQ